MPFPPDLTNAWDNTFPPDTQLANLLGQDLRSFRVDTQQRLSLLSGKLANRPSNMDAVFGGAEYGILFFATDTGQIFQWTGAVPAWVDVTTNLTGGKLSNSVSVVTNGAPQDGLVIIINKGLLVPGSIVHINAWIDSTAGVGATSQVQFNTNSIAGNLSANTIYRVSADFIVRADGIIEGTAGIQTGLGSNLATGTYGNAIVGNNTLKTIQTVAGGGTVGHNMLDVWWK